MPSLNGTPAPLLLAYLCLLLLLGVQVPGLLLFGLLVFAVNTLGSRRAGMATLLRALHAANDGFNQAMA